MANAEGGKLNRDEFQKFWCVLPVIFRNLSQVKKVLQAYKSLKGMDSNTMLNAKKWSFL